MKILVHCSFFFYYYYFWHEWVLNFILAEKEDQRAFSELTKRGPRAKSLKLIFSHSILGAKIKILRPPVGTGFKLSL